MRRSAGPFNAAPFTIGEIAHTESRREERTSSTPASDRIGAMETSGLDGAINMESALANMSKPFGFAVCDPANVTADTATLW